MSSESLAFLRKNAGEELAGLAEQHLKHDLTEGDRTTLESAARSFSTHTAVGSALGLGLCLVMAARIRATRMNVFKAFQTAEKPTHVRFASGREETIPDVTNMMRPSRLGDFATYCFFGAAGVFLGGETGALTGSWSASRQVQSDLESKKRIETAFRSFRADVLRREAAKLESGEHGFPHW